MSSGQCYRISTRVNCSITPSRDQARPFSSLSSAAFNRKSQTNALCDPFKKNKKKQAPMRFPYCCSCVSITTSAVCASFGSSSADAYPFPYGSSEPLGFGQCRNPIQLEKSIASYLRSHPEPTEHALVTMLTACASMSKNATADAPHSADQRNARVSHVDKGYGKSKLQQGTPISQGVEAAEWGSGLLQTILQSSTFTADEVYRIACTIHDKIATGLHLHQGQDSVPHANPSLQVTNAFLDVCAITGHFDKAWSVLQDMTHRTQGNVKPDLTTYRHVLKAATVYKGSSTDQSADDAKMDQKIKDVIEQGSESLTRQARISFWMKLGLGGLAGVTVGKFATLGVMAFSTSDILGTSARATEDTSHLAIDTSYAAESAFHLLASQEVAAGIGFVAGLLTAGYFIIGSTGSSIVRVPHRLGSDRAKDEPGSKRRHPHALENLPRARLLGLYFPDLATINKEEIRNYLKATMES
ncbi:hypothetical protein BG011_004715 [Mortierella polycephala]|uniref:Uncharacterized protein n=1 Tax=Mortierella polycephala TaxID=41804 RepID=A0A9P6PZT9_9FUNG|nr:hypothetical protein BG011_004715 [Mortierella polycephala]